MNELRITETLIHGYRSGGIPGAVSHLLGKSIDSNSRGIVRAIGMPGTVTQKKDKDKDKDKASVAHTASPNPAPIIKAASIVWASKYALRGSHHRMSPTKNTLMSHVQSIRRGPSKNVKYTSRSGMPINITAG